MASEVGNIGATSTNINNNTLSNGTSIQASSTEVALNGTPDSVGDGFITSNAKSGHKKSKKKIADESEDAANFRHIIYSMRYDIKPDELKELVKKTFTDKTEAASVLAFIDQLNLIMYPESYKKLIQNSKNDVEKSILAVYIGNAQEEANTGLLADLTNDKVTNFSVKLDHLKKGIYYDKDGNKIRGKKFPGNSYEKEALNEILPALMEAKISAIVEKLQKEGKLKNIKSDKQLEKLIISTAESVSGKDAVFRKYIKKDPEILLRARREATVLQRREELKHVSLEEIEKELSPATLKSIKKYMNQHINKDGTYDLSEFSKTIEDRASKEDYLVNRSTEIETTWRGFVGGKIDNHKKEYFVNLADFDKPGLGSSRSQTMELIKFCRFPIEKKDHSLLIGKETISDATSAASAAATAFSQVRVSSKTFVELIGLPGSVGTIEQATKVVIEANIGTALLPIAVGTTAGTMIRALIGRDPQEKDCFNQLDFNSKNEMYYKKENYVQYLKDIGEYDKVKDELELYEKFATPLTDGSDWDYNEFLNTRRVSGGLGSFNNCHEGVKIQKDGGSEIHQDGLVVTTDKTIEDQSQEQISETKDENDIIFKKEARRSSWQHLTTLYNCGDKSLVEICGGNVNKAIRIIKIAQAVTDGDYSFERLNELYKLSIKGARNLQNIKGINYDVYYDVLMNNFPPAVKLPTNLAGAERCEISNDEHELKLGYKLDPSQIANTPAAKGPANGTIIISSVINRTNNKVMYGVVVPGQKAQWFPRATERDAAVQKIIEQNPTYILKNVSPREFDEIANQAT